MKNEYFKFLNWLRGTGATNMFGAVPYLIAEFEELNENEAKAVLLEWMENYEKYCEL